jgi:predicted nucleic acid-binding Zn ribbon protein
VRTCPECKKRKVRRLISQTSFVLKGSGWYVTDYARKGASSSGNGGKKGSAEKKTEPKKAEPKTDSSKAGGSATAQR